MARRRKRQYRRKGGRRTRFLQYENTLPLLTLAADDVVASVSPPTAEDRTYLRYHKGTWSLRNHTDSEGPISFGLAHSDVSAAEIETYLENTATWFESDIAAQINRQFGRFIKRVGMFHGTVADQVLNDGMAVYTRLGFTINEDQGINIWARNASGAVLTTGSVIVTEGFVASNRA